MFNNKEKQMRDDLQKNFRLTFSSSSGKKVLDYLQNITINKISPANISTNELYYLEGQRSLIKFIQNFSK
ncbi:MAG: hypothetical protein LBR35_01525 [Rickettsiales bacterium]|jgi:hypothetical protein|nr:hypothetical protein [Rickettsiales bacterium]